MSQTARNDASVARALSVLIALVCGLLIVITIRSMMLWLTPEMAWKAPRIIEPVKSVSLSPNALRFDPSFDPFHRGVVNQPAQTFGLDAPETTLQLRLVGRRAGPRGTAILQTQDGQQNVYAVDDSIMDDVFLKAVTSDFIVLSRNGQIERLTFEGQERGNMLISEQAPQPQAPQSKASIQTGDVNWLQMIELSRETQEGRTLGYALSSKDSSFDLARFGFQPGDILTGIGDEDLTQGRPELAELSRLIQNQTSVDISVLRDGRPLTFTLGSL